MLAGLALLGTAGAGGAVAAPSGALAERQTAAVAATELRLVRASHDGTAADLVVAVPAVLSGRALAADAFTVDSDRGPVTASSARIDPAATDLAVVVTAPGTAGGAPPGTTATDVQRAALVELLQAQPAGVRVAVVADDPPRLVTTFDRPVDEAIRALATPGALPLREDDALRLAVEAARRDRPPAPSAEGERRAVVLAVGGGLPRATETPSWWPNDVMLFTARVDDTEPPAAAVANPTGGTTGTTNVSGAIAALDAVRADLDGQYRITVRDLPADAGSVTVRVRAAEADAAITYAFAPAAGIGASPLPEAPPASAVTGPVASTVGDGGNAGPWLAGVLVTVAVLAGLVMLGIDRSRRRREGTTPTAPAVPPASAAASGTAPSGTAPSVPASNPKAPATPAAPSVAPPAPVGAPAIVVLAGPSTATHRPSLRAAACEIVHSPADALRAVVRTGAPTIVIEPGASGGALLLDAVARHDAASDRTTRVVAIDDDGRIIDLRAAVSATAPPQGVVPSPA